MNKPRTPDDWQLFTASASPDGEVTPRALELAAAALSGALDRAEASVRGGTDPYEAYDRFIAPIAEEHDGVGAADTEPRDVAIEYLSSLVEEDR